MIFAPDRGFMTTYPNLSPIASSKCLFATWRSLQIKNRSGFVAASGRSFDHSEKCDREMNMEAILSKDKKIASGE
jgi:hypothetical protein